MPRSWIQYLSFLWYCARSAFISQRDPYLTLRLLLSTLPLCHWCHISYREFHKSDLVHNDAFKGHAFRSYHFDFAFLSLHHFVAIHHSLLHKIGSSDWISWHWTSEKWDSAPVPFCCFPRAWTISSHCIFVNFPALDFPVQRNAMLAFPRGDATHLCMFINSGVWPPAKLAQLLILRPRHSDKKHCSFFPSILFCFLSSRLRENSSKEAAVKKAIWPVYSVKFASISYGVMGDLVL